MKRPKLKRAPFFEKHGYSVISPDGSTGPHDLDLLDAMVSLRKFSGAGLYRNADGVLIAWTTPPISLNRRKSDI